MSVAAFKLENFLSTFREHSLARVNRFEVLLGAPTSLQSYRYLTRASLYCEVANFPPINLTVKPFKIFGPSYQRPITSEYGGDGMSMTFHVDRDMNIKRFFEDWIEYIVDRDNFTVAYQDEYIASIFVRQLDEENNVTYEIELLEAFPRSMTLMDLNNTAQNQTHRLNIIFGYRYWRRTDIPRNQAQVELVPTKRFEPAISSSPLDTSGTFDNNNITFDGLTFTFDQSGPIS